MTEKQGLKQVFRQWPYRYGRDYWCMGHKILMAVATTVSNNVVMLSAQLYSLFCLSTGRVYGSTVVNF